MTLFALTFNDRYLIEKLWGFSLQMEWVDAGGRFLNILSLRRLVDAGFVIVNDPHQYYEFDKKYLDDRPHIRNFQTQTNVYFIKLSFKGHWLHYHRVLARRKANRLEAVSEQSRHLGPSKTDSVSKGLQTP